MQHDNMAAASQRTSDGETRCEPAHSLDRLLESKAHSCGGERSGELRRSASFSLPPAFGLFKMSSACDSHHHFHMTAIHSTSAVFNIR